MWIASVPLWALAGACFLSAVDIGWRAAEIDSKKAPGAAGISFILALLCCSAFAAAATYIGRL